MQGTLSYFYLFLRTSETNEIRFRMKILVKTLVSIGRHIGILLPAALISVSCLAGKGDAPVAQQGLLDLRNCDLSQKPVVLDGQWGFYWQKILSPDSRHPDQLFDPFAASSGNTSPDTRASGSRTGFTPAYVPFPVLWNDLRLNGQPLSPQGYGTYTLTILLPRKRPRIGMEVPDVYCAYKLYVNGVAQVQNGIPGRNASESRPYWLTRTIALPPGEPDTLFLVMQVSNFWHAKGGPYKHIRIGDKDMLFDKKNREAAYDFILAGCLFMGGLFFLGLHVFGRDDKTTLYFSLFCILYSYRMIGTDAYVLHSLFPDLSWFLTIRAEYLSLSAGIALFCMYTRHLYPEDVHPKVLQGMVWFCALYTALIIFTPPLIFTRCLNIFLMAMFICIAYAMYVYLHAARKRRSGSLYALLSTAVMLLIFLLLNLHYFGIIPRLNLIIFLGYIAFFFLQSLSMSHRFAWSLNQAAIQARQGLKAKSEFLSTMSHEIRTPLNAVIGMTHILLNSNPRKEQKKDLDVLLFSARNLLSIVNNILDYNKIEEGKIIFEHIPMDLPAIARNIVASFQSAAMEKSVSLVTEIDKSLEGTLLLGDPTRTSQVINNLVHNAVKFTAEGSVRLILQAGPHSEGAIAVTIRVEDTGIGIPWEKQSMIFDRFTQADSSTSRSYGGTGLGLAITRRILELQDVSLHLTSEPGKGAAFYFTQTFQVSEIKHQEAPAFYSNDRQGQLLKNICILLVEDNPLNVLVAQTILQRVGATVDVATNGQEALESLDASRHHLVLMDLHMPGIDGYEATTLLRKRGETLPIIALTASTPREVENEAMAAGLNDVVVKPFNPDDLYGIILKYARPSVIQ